MKIYLQSALRALLKSWGYSSRACLAAPLLIFLIAARPFAAPPDEARPAAKAIEPDLVVIDSVLSQRAPGLGRDQRSRIAATLIDECRTAGYDPLLILSVIAVESEFDEAALSFRGARGLMQFRPNTLAWFAEKSGVRLSSEEIYRDPAMTVRLGIRYIKSLENQFHTIDLALMAYNAGPNRLRLAIHDGDADHFRGYVRLVRNDYAKFRRSLGLSPSTALAMRWAAWSEALSAADDL
jgi:soluble lytic murein transglycosylase-like protein